VLLAAGTRIVAVAVVSPDRDEAVDRARAGVFAGVTLSEGGATVATVGGGLGGGTSPLTNTCGATALRAGTPIGPVGDGAVDGARGVVAVASFLSGRACNTTVRCSAGDCAEARASTTAAADGAYSPSSPTRDFAIDGAAFDTTRYSLLECRNGDTTVLGSGDDGAGAGLGTSSASEGAVAVAGPTGHDTIDGAGVHVTASVLGQVRARATTVGSALEDGPVARLATAAAISRASRPAIPAGDDAVDRARARHRSRGGASGDDQLALPVGVSGERDNLLLIGCADGGRSTDAVGVFGGRLSLELSRDVASGEGRAHAVGVGGGCNELVVAGGNGAYNKSLAHTVVEIGGRRGLELVDSADGVGAALAV
jgi:hypothetical protein